MPVDPAAMPSKMPGEVLMTDRPCARCGYNLRGLEAGGRCPECGTPITVRKKSVRFADGLVDAPMWYIKLIALAMGMMAISVVGVIAAWLMVVSGGPFAGMLAFTASAGLWFAAAWIVTIERPRGERTLKDEILDHQKLREACRWSQAAGLASMGLIWAGYFTGVGLLDILGGIVMLGALFGLVPFGVYLSALADWSGDTGVGGRLRASVWCIAVCGTLLAASIGLMSLGFSLGFILPVLTPILSIVVVVGLALFGWSVVQLSISAGWAIQNSHVAREREIRMEEKRREREAREQERARAAEMSLAEAEALRRAEVDEVIPEAIPLSDGELQEQVGEIRHTKRAEITGIEQPVEDPGPQQDIYELAPDDEE